MNDKELLELAAKAAGIKVLQQSNGYWTIEVHERGLKGWNPLTDDGDALRLAVKLEIEFASRNETSRADTIGKPIIYVDHEYDEYSATRRAIVRSAAEIGKAK